MWWSFEVRLRFSPHAQHYTLSMLVQYRELTQVGSQRRDALLKYAAEATHSVAMIQGRAFDVLSDAFADKIKVQQSYLY